MPSPLEVRKSPSDSDLRTLWRMDSIQLISAIPSTSWAIRTTATPTSSTTPPSSISSHSHSLPPLFSFLNVHSRTSVLAAANPIFGHYDDSKSVGDNIDLMTTILSRFDCIFIVRDVRDVERDKNIARHVLGVHMTASSDTAATGDIDVPTLKKLIAYCRERCAPRLSDEASALLSDQYVHIRNSVRESLKNNPTDTVVVPITIRQLEALVRLSESLAKMRLSAEATVSDVEEALRLFKVQYLTLYCIMLPCSTVSTP